MFVIVFKAGDEVRHADVETPEREVISRDLGNGMVGMAPCQGQSQCGVRNQKRRTNAGVCGGQAGVRNIKGYSNSRSLDSQSNIQRLNTHRCI